MVVEGIGKAAWGNPAMADDLMDYMTTAL